jgi:hypothetical protein
MGSAHALDATNTWRGSILVTDVTDACIKPGFPTVGQTLLAVFRPKLETDDPSDPPAAMLITFNNGALLVSPTANPPGSSGQYRGDVIQGVAAYGMYTGGTYSLKTKPSLDTFDETTTQLTMTKGSKITKFRNTVGCTVTFEGSFFKGVL